MLRVALLNGTNRNKDKDVSKIIESIINTGTVKGLNIVWWAIQPWYWFIEVTRSNGEVFNCLVDVTEAIDVDVSGTKKVWIEVKQANINDGSSNNPTWEGIAEVKTGASYPSTNFLKVASITSWVVTDDRKLVTVRSDIMNEVLNTYASISYVDSAIASAWAITKLTENTFVLWQAVVKDDMLFVEDMISFSQITWWTSIWENNSRKRVWFPVIWNWVAINSLPLKLKNIWNAWTQLWVRIENMDWSLVNPNAQLVLDWNKISKTEFSDKYNVDNALWFTYTGIQSWWLQVWYRIQAKKNTRIKSIRKQSDTTMSSVTIIDILTWVSQWTASFSWDDAVFTNSIFLTNWREYLIRCDWSYSKNIWVTYPITSFSDFNITWWFFNGSYNTTTWYVIKNIFTEEDFPSFTSPITIPSVARIVLYQWTYWSETVSSWAYFSIAGAIRYTLARPTQSYNWSSWTNDNSTFTYFESIWVHKSILSKTNATYSYMLPYDNISRIAQVSWSIWQIIPLTSIWFHKFTTPLLANTLYYIWNIDGTLSTTPWTNNYKVWYTNNAGELYVEKQLQYLWSVSISSTTVAIHPWCQMMIISGRTSSAIAEVTLTREKNVGTLNMYVTNNMYSNTYTWSGNNLTTSTTGGTAYLYWYYKS